MDKKAEIVRRIQQAHPDAAVSVTDVSSEHAGHAEAPASGQSHFDISVADAGFKSLSELDCHRKIMAAIGDMEELGIHAIRIKASSA